MPLALKIVLTALIVLAAFIAGLQPLGNLLWDLSNLLPGWLFVPLLEIAGLVLRVVVLGIPGLLIWLIWRRGG